MMACFSINLSVVSLLILLLLLLHCCIVMSSKTMDLIVREPDIYIPSEAGSIEIWSTNDQFVVHRYTIHPNGIVLPFYNVDSEELFYILQGKTIIGLMINGCSKKLNGGKNECDKIYSYQKGDVAALQAGETLWGYNNGNETLIIIAVNPVINNERLRAYLAGPQKILRGFSTDFISKAFNIDDELSMKLQKKDLRGSFIYAIDGGLHLSCPSQYQLEPKVHSNDTEKSFCNINTRKTNIFDPSKSDFFIPKVGHIKTIDAQQLPVLNSIQLSATYILLFKDVMRLPHWDNSYSIIYVVQGEGWIQIVDENGKNVFDGLIKGGQLLIVPKNFVIAEVAKTEIFEYITFKTNVNPITSYLTGRNSVIYNLPVEVITNAYDITKEEAKDVKFGRKELSLAKITPKNI